MNVAYTVFTKPWKMPLKQLGELVRRLGFDGVELPVRPGYQVLPENVRRDLPRAAAQLAEQGIRIASIAGPTDEVSIAACAEAGVPIIRICVGIGPDGYPATAERLQREYDALVPLLDRHGVALGIQNHCGRYVSHALGLRDLIGKYEPRHVCAVWDAAHNALNGEEADLALDIVWPHLRMVNLKNAYWQRQNGPEAEHARWRPHWTLGRHGLASWPKVASELRRRGYCGPLCLTAEYSDEAEVDRLIAEDLKYARSLFG